MTAKFATQNHSFNRTASASAACTSARFVNIMDTAIMLVVSILILPLRLWVC